MTASTSGKKEQGIRRSHPPADSLAEVSLLQEDDIYLFNEGSHFRLHEKLGSHLLTAGDTAGTYFAVWAPDAEQVFVMGDFNDWSKINHPLRPKKRSGIWQGFIAGVEKGSRYKYHIVSRYNDYRVYKTDPFAFYNEPPPETVSIVWNLEYTWGVFHRHLVIHNVVWRMPFEELEEKLAGVSGFEGKELKLFIHRLLDGEETPFTRLVDGLYRLAGEAKKNPRLLELLNELPANPMEHIRTLPEASTFSRMPIRCGVISSCSANAASTSSRL